MQNLRINKIPGRELALLKQRKLAEQISTLPSKPVLKIIQVGEDPASTLYVDLKVQTATKIGIDAQAVRFSKDTDLDEVVKVINSFNLDSEVHGVMVQSPIPGLDLHKSLKVFNAISEQKDVDALSYASLGKLWQLKSLQDLQKSDFFVSATPLAVLDCLVWLGCYLEDAEATQEEILARAWSLDQQSRTDVLEKMLVGRSALVVNRSNIVGKPLVALLELGNATVTLAHSHTENLKKSVAEYDLVFLATGVDNFVSASDFEAGQVVIDIGIKASPGQPVRGDVRLQDDTQAQTSLLQGINTSPMVHLAPVPGGVGPLTVVNLLSNTYDSYLRSQVIT